MSNIPYIIFLFCSLSLFFVLVRGSVIDLETEYVPDNIVIGSYIFSLLYVLLNSIINKNVDSVKTGIIGFIVAFGIPYVLSTIVYYYKYFTWKYYNKGKELPILEENELTENPPISKKLYKTLYIIGCVLIVLIGVFTKNYLIIILGLISLMVELLLGKLLKRFCVIKFNYAEEKFKEDSIEKEIEDDLDTGVGGGDIIIFGAIGIMFGALGFIITLIYSIIAQAIVILIYSLIKKINPFEYPIPFLPGIALGVLIYSCGLDQYLLNFFNLISSLLS